MERAQNGCKAAKEQSLSSEASDQTALADTNDVVSPEASSLARCASALLQSSRLYSQISAACLENSNAYVPLT